MPTELPTPEIQTLHWLQIPDVSYQNNDFSSVPQDFVNFLATDGLRIQEQIQEAWKLIDSMYEEEQAAELKRVYMFATVTTQHNEGKDGKKRYRKNEVDTDKNPLPTAVHFTRILNRALAGSDKPLDPTVAKAIMLHDVPEDVELTTDTKKYEKRDFIQVIDNEFSDNNSDIRLTDLIDMVTKYDESDEELNSLLRKSEVYKTMHSKIIAHATELQEENIGADVMKAVSSVYNILKIAHERYGHNDAQYLQAVTSAFLIKGLDIADNFGSAGTSYGGILRARFFATALRIMNSPISDSVMEGLTKNTVTDPIYPQLDYSLLSRNIEVVSNNGSVDALQGVIQEIFGQNTSVTLSYPVPFPDEDDNRSRTRTFGSAQAIVRLPKDAYDVLIKNPEQMITSSAIQEYLPKNAGLVEFSGILSRMIAANGRDNTQYEVTDINKGNGKDYVLLTIRIMTNEPNLADVPYGEDPLACPEKAFFLLPKNAETVPDAILRLQMLMLEPSKL